MDRKKMLLAIGIGKPEGEYLEFDPPEGLDVADIKEGEEKEVVAKIQKKPDGKLCLVEINGIPLSKNDDEEEPDYGDEFESEESEVRDSDTSQSSPLPAQSGLGERARTAGLM